MRLRDKIKRAIGLKSKVGLEKIIEECEEAGYPELVDDLRKARDTLEILGGGRGG